MLEIRCPACKKIIDSIKDKDIAKFLEGFEKEPHMQCPCCLGIFDNPYWTCKY